MGTRTIARAIKTLAVTGILLAPCAVPAMSPHSAPGAVYTMTNAAAGNQVIVYDRSAGGSLRFSGAFATGGQGSGNGLGNQGGVVLSDDGRWLLVVNAGSGELSAFSVGADGLTLADTVSSGGVRPVSVTISRDLVYVVHAGGSVGDVDSISGLRLGSDGTLSPLPASTRPLSGPNVAPAQIAFSPDGQFLLVTEKGSNTIAVFRVDTDGYAEPAVFNASSGQTPFALDFGKRDQVFVSEVFGGAEDSGAVSSYSLQPDGQLMTIDASIPNTETAPCWLVVTRDGRYVFTTNTPDDSLSAYAIDFEGHLDLLAEGGRSGEPGIGANPLDMDLSDDGRFLFTLNVGNNTISTFRVLPDGSLKLLQATPNLPAGVNGLAAR